MYKKEEDIKDLIRKVFQNPEEIKYNLDDWEKFMKSVNKKKDIVSFVKYLAYKYKDIAVLRNDNVDFYVSVSQYAKEHGTTARNIRYKCEQGALKSAVKPGRNYIINMFEPLIDQRIKSGKYIKSKS